MHQTRWLRDTFLLDLYPDLERHWKRMWKLQLSGGILCDVINLRLLAWECCVFVAVCLST